MVVDGKPLFPKGLITQPIFFINLQNEKQRFFAWFF